MHFVDLISSQIFRRVVPTIVLGGLASIAGNAHAQKDQPAGLPKSACSYGRTNSDCYLLIDRNDPVSPVTMQLYSGSQVTIILIHPRIYESYTLDPVYPPTQAANSNDVANTLPSGIFQNIQKFGGAEPGSFGFMDFDPTAASDACPPSITIDSAHQGEACFKTLEVGALSIYKSLVQCETPDAITPSQQSSSADACSALVSSYAASGGSELANDIQSFISGESNLSGAIAAYLKGTPDLRISARLGMKIKDYDALAQDLNAYNKRLIDLSGNPPTFELLCKKPEQGTDPLNSEIRKDARCSNESRGTYSILLATRDNLIYGPSTSRPASFQLNFLNLVTNAQAATIDPTKKKAVATVNLNFADSKRWVGGNTFRWEGSAGVFFSAIPDRSFSVSPLYYQTSASTTDPANCPAASAKNAVGTVCDNIVTQKILRPSIVPFTAVHYRISPDAKFIPWKTALYMTGAVGYNVNTTSADFAGGLSLNWRSIMISPLWHFGHDVKLTNGLYVNESLGAGFKGNLTTEDYWRNMFAVGVSLRVSALTGR